MVTTPTTSTCGWTDDLLWAWGWGTNNNNNLDELLNII